MTNHHQFLMVKTVQNCLRSLGIQKKLDVGGQRQAQTAVEMAAGSLLGMALGQVATVLHKCIPR